MASRWARLAPVSGFVFVAGIVLALSLGDTPSAGDSGAKVLHYYTVHKHAMQVLSFAVAFAGVAGLAFYITLAAYLRRRGATRGLVAGINAGVTMIAVGMTALAGSTLALTDHTSKMPADVASTLNWINEDLLWITVFAGVAVVALSVGGATLQTRAFPRWVGWVALVIGVAALTGAASWFAFMATWALTLGLAITLLVRGDDANAALPAPDLPGARVPADDVASPARA